eukprot:974737-Pyramimonas_sp.AAC.1
MSLKAAEVSVMIGFVLSQLEKWGGAERFGAPLLGAGTSLVTLKSELAAHEGVPSPAGMMAIRAALDAHIMCSKAAGIKMSPKHHLLCHMVHRIAGGRRG